MPNRGGWPVKLSVFLIVVLWTIPSLGLLVSSFRPASEATATGWWTALFSPLATD